MLTFIYTYVCFYVIIHVGSVETSFHVLLVMQNA